MTIESLLGLKAVLVLTVLVVFVVYERARPAAGGPLLLRVGRATHAAWHRLARNLGLFSVNVALSPLIVVPVTVWAESWSIDWRPLWWDGWWALALDVLLLDLWIYWWHRANHVLPVLWRFHQVHHLDETLDTSSALRFHFGEVVLSALTRAVAMIALDLPLGSVLLFEGIVLACAIFHHSDARLPSRLEGGLARWIITPSIHWVHHHAIRADTDSNYGTLFSFWDRLFGSRSATARWPEMPIGVEGAADRRFLDLLRAPFRR